MPVITRQGNTMTDVYINVFTTSFDDDHSYDTVLCWTARRCHKDKQLPQCVNHLCATFISKFNKWLWIFMPYFFSFLLSCSKNSWIRNSWALHHTKCTVYQSKNFWVPGSGNTVCSTTLIRKNYWNLVGIMKIRGAPIWNTWDKWPEFPSASTLMDRDRQSRDRQIRDRQPPEINFQKNYSNNLSIFLKKIRDHGTTRTGKKTSFGLQETVLPVSVINGAIRSGLRSGLIKTDKFPYFGWTIILWATVYSV